VDLGNGAEIDLPAGMILYPRAAAERLLGKVGEPTEGVVAIVQQPDAGWSVLLSYTAAGYVDDSDARALDAGELLAAYRADTRAQNERRKLRGMSELVVDGWAEPPRYDRARHRLAWGLAAHTAEGRLANRFTRILGRGGFLSVNLIDEAETMARSQAEARSIVEATRWKPGARYGDHAPGDPRAATGLRGLVLGGAGVGAAGKLGLLATIVVASKPAIPLVLVMISGLAGWLRRQVLRGLRRSGPASPWLVDLDGTGVDEALDVLVR